MPPPERTAPPSSSPSRTIKERVAAFYDANADDYLAWTAASHPIRLHYLSQLLPHLQGRDDATILELGCGAGVPCTQVLTSLPNVHVTGVDISRTQLELAAKVLPAEKVSLVMSDMIALEFEDASFDAVVAFYSIIHVPREEQLVLIRRIARWLKPAGTFLATLNMDGMEESMEEKVPMATSLFHQKPYLWCCLASHWLTDASGSARNRDGCSGAGLTGLRT